uniref:Uncharacterized protein n=1 Tax=Gasterosteus aculeatus TaxID=69293 RepID=G3PKF6_GASAC
ISCPLFLCTQSVADSLVDDFVVTDSVAAEDVANAQAVEVQPEIVSNTKSESVDASPAEPLAAPAEETLIDAAAEQKCSEVLSEEPKQGMCDIPCQMQLASGDVGGSGAERTRRSGGLHRGLDSLHATRMIFFSFCVCKTPAILNRSFAARI